ncbi:MAG: hypothetical protein AAF531_05420 [Actinomycetota bacterium]
MSGRSGGRTRGPKGSKGKKKASKAKKRRPVRVVDPSDTADTETRYVQPYEAVKTYLCPGCNRDIPPGQGHMVAIPPDAPDLRRHWHRGCWNNRASRR